MEIWHIPFKGRNHSGVFKDNFLWQKGNVYIMDNHRLALWCWLRHLKRDEKIDLVHIDQHYDCLQSRHDDWLNSVPEDLDALSLGEYRKYQWKNPICDCELFRYDNYLSLFLSLYKDNISSVYFSTHGDGDRPNIDKFNEFNVVESLGYLNAMCSGLNHNQAIINIDLDYFTETGFEKPFIITTDEYFHEFCNILSTGIEESNIKCLTFSLSPEHTGSWELAEEIFAKINRFMSLGFSLK